MAGEAERLSKLVAQFRVSGGHSLAGDIPIPTTKKAKPSPVSHGDLAIAVGEDDRDEF